MIKVENLRFTYLGQDTESIKNLSFDIEQGEIFGFLGPSGAGKSTTQKILYKILNGYSGDVLIDNKRLEDWGSNYFLKIGVGFELPNHYLKLTGRENLELFRTFYNSNNFKPIKELFQMVDLVDSMDKRVDSYSKGMKMRLNFIRSIMHNPEILFFDEPTSGLDPTNAHIVKNHIKSLKAEGKTIFITTHVMATADELCDRVYFIVDGEIRITESPKSLKLKYGEKKVRVESESHEIREFELDNIGGNADFLNFIKKNPLRINTMEASLEEVFIQVTGKKLISTAD